MITTKIIVLLAIAVFGIGRIAIIFIQSSFEQLEKEYNKGYENGVAHTTAKMNLENWKKGCETILNKEIKIKLTEDQIRGLISSCGCHDWKCRVAVPEITILINKSQIVED